MERKLPHLARRHQAALREHLQNESAADLSKAQALGKLAMRRGLQIQDLAKIREAAPTAVILPHHAVRGCKSRIRRCVAFFAKAAAPVQPPNCGTRKANHHRTELLETLTERTIELANSNLLLGHEITRRHEMENSLRLSELTSSKLLAQSLQMQEELRRLSHRLLAAQEEERRRISRDLHDVIAQMLTGINLRLASLKSQTKASTRDIHQKIGATQRMVEKSVAIVQRFARDLLPATLDHLGLIPALQTFLRSFMEGRSTRVTLITYDTLEKLPVDILTVLYRIVQEALTNVERHTRAFRVRVCFYEEAGEACLQIRDNGQGFVVSSVTPDKKIIHLGLLGIRERVEMVDGRFTVKSAPSKGTTRSVRIPPAQAKAVDARRAAAKMATTPGPAGSVPRKPRPPPSIP